MNTTEMINEIARRTQPTPNPLTHKQVAIVIDSLIDLMIEELSSPEGEIRLKQIGVFRVKRTKMPSPVGLQISVPKPASSTYQRLCFYPASTVRKHLKVKSNFATDKSETLSNFDWIGC